jgi:hypothetical protein
MMCPDPTVHSLAETVNGLNKTEVICRRSPWRSLEAVEFATLEWVDWLRDPLILYLAMLVKLFSVRQARA